MEHNPILKNPLSLDSEIPLYSQVCKQPFPLSRSRLQNSALVSPNDDISAKT